MTDRPDPVVQALGVITRTLRDWPVTRIPPGPAEERDPSPFLPGGDRHIPKMMIYGTPVMPVRAIPFGREKTPAELREEAAAKVRAVFRELGVLQP